MIKKNHSNIRRNTFIVCAIIMIIMFAQSLVSEPVNAADGTGKVKPKSGVVLRKKASSSSKKVKKLKKNATVVIKKEVFTTKNKSSSKKKWYYVQYGSKTGYIRSDMLKSVNYQSESGRATDDLNYRAGAGTKMKRKGTFKKGASFIIVLEAKPKGSNQLWYKVKKGSKYYYVCGDWVTKDPNAVIPTGPVQSAYALSVADGACGWAVSIANDNSFHYGNGTHSRHNGCYFCGTQPSSKKKYVVQWEKTYCCNPFITAAYAHGGNEPTMLSLCSRAKSYMSPEFKASPLFYNLGKPALSSLKRGDVLCNSKHVAMYIGDGKLVEAATADDGVPYSSKWNSSIRVTSLSSSRYSGFTAAYRYIGNN